MKDWVEICPGIAVKEWRHQPADPKAKARRHIVVRKQISRRPQAGGKLLFEDLPDYRFSLYVTNLDLPLDQIWNIYNSRADCENQDQGAKARLRPRRLLPARLLGHGGLVPLHHGGLQPDEPVPALWAQQSQPGHLGDLRSYCFAIGGWVSQHARKRVLKLSLPRKKRPWMDAIFQQIEARPPPFAYSIA
jgi:hypothetical protein